MKRMIDHALLDNAKANKKDEFYTQMVDIEKEMTHYGKHFAEKNIYCNCANCIIVSEMFIKLYKNSIFH